MTDTDVLIDANEEFYAAFATGNTELMINLWSRQTDITCIHPGWSPLQGYDDVMESWRCILSSTPPITGVSNARAYMYGDIGYVICREHLERGILIATNIFALEAKRWKLVHHQAGISPSEPATHTNDGPRTLQ